LIIGLLKEDANVILENFRRDDLKIVAKENNFKRKASADYKNIIDKIELQEKEEDDVTVRKESLSNKKDTKGQEDSLA